MLVIQKMLCFFHTLLPTYLTTVLTETGFPPVFTVHHLNTTLYYSFLGLIECNLNQTLYDSHCKLYKHLFWSCYDW